MPQETERKKLSSQLDSVPQTVQTVSYELPTEFKVSLDRKKQRGKMFLQLLVAFVSVGGIVYFSLPIVKKFFEIKDAKVAVERMGEGIEQAHIKYDSQTSFPSRIKELNLFLPDNKTPFENKKCQSTHCINSGKFSYSIYEGKLEIYREDPVDDLHRYYFLAKFIPEGSVSYCYALNNDAATVCEALGATFLPEGDPLQDPYMPPVRGLQTFKF